MMQGTLLGNEKLVDIRGRVRSVYCPAASWDDTIEPDNFAAAKMRGYALECERLQIVEAPNPLNLTQSSMELTASTDAIIEGSGGLYGKAQTIKYNQAKNMVDMNGNVTIQTTTKDGQTPRQSAEGIRYNIETRSVELLQVKGLSIN